MFLNMSSGTPVNMDYYRFGGNCNPDDYPQVVRGIVISSCDNDHEEEEEEEEEDENHYGHYSKEEHECKEKELEQKEERLVAWEKRLKEWNQSLMDREEELYKRNMEEIDSYRMMSKSMHKDDAHETPEATEMEEGSDKYWGFDKKCKAYQAYIDVHGYHFSKELAFYAVSKMKNADGSKRAWKLNEVKDMMEKHNAQKPENATWGDVFYVFSMLYSDGFPTIYKNELDLVKGTLAYLKDPDAPEGVAFIRWLAVMDYMKEKVKWSEMI